MDHATHAAGTRIDIPLLTSFIEQERERCKVPNCSYHELLRPGSRRARAPLPVGLHDEVQAAGVTHERVKKPSKACTSPRRPRLRVTPARKPVEVPACEPPCLHRDVCCRAAPVVYDKRSRTTPPPFCVEVREGGVALSLGTVEASRS